ncbi:hypothetical protein PFHG_05455 [Plasmodium falciparum HB3]|uniref:Duffy-binding-like domain-containing protein n=1 Tax=Plasmodium falciparum (isolate HB3) TaxID=137071 RepID=A0A0L7KLS5_PLAFX|nr:hypothetical protein PFHG_05455 [Plasmodium falciparum HB3]
MVKPREGSRRPRHQVVPSIGISVVKLRSQPHSPPNYGTEERDARGILRYKKGVGTKEKEGFTRRSGEDYNSSTVADSVVKMMTPKPEDELKRGNIPIDFLRLMFYTLGDYRDICIGGDRDIVGDTIYKDTSDKDKEGGVTKKISEKIKQILSKLNGTHVPEKPVQTPQVWWDTNAQHIWNGMICALTYNTDTQSGQTPTQIDAVKSALLENGKQPKKNGKYNYNTVKLDENSETQAKSTESQASGENTLLTQFVLRPPYFRYLEEWGETFCRERQKRLDQIYRECKVGENDRGGKKNPKCSCYGEDCEKIREQDYDTVADLECPGCGRECRKYKNWIKKKRTEFDKQKNAYTEQKNNYVNEHNDAERNNNNNGFCAKLKETCTDAAAFLKRLKSGPCSKTNNGGSDITFDDKGDTFKPAKDCKPCSEFKINCQNGKCSNGDDTNVGCNCKKNGNDYITASDIKNGCNSTHKLDMLVSDNSTTEVAHGLGDCKSSGIFTGIIEKKWECGNFCGYVLCKPKNGNGQNDATYIIQIRALFKRWLEYFFDDYNRIRKKLNLCTKNGEESKCISGCRDKCKCVEKWINTKKDEWGKITQRLNEQYKNHDQTYPVRSFLETLIPQIPVANVQNWGKKVIKLSKFDNSCGCSFSAHSTNGKDDAIDCMLEKLSKETEKCQEHQNIVENQTTCGGNTHPDDDLPLEETEDVKAPNICPSEQVEQKPARRRYL